MSVRVPFLVNERPRDDYVAVSTMAVFKHDYVHPGFQSPPAIFNNMLPPVPWLLRGPNKAFFVLVGMEASWITFCLLLNWIGVLS